MAFEYAGLGLFVLLGILFPITGIMATKLMRPHRPNARKESAYECGEIPIGETPPQFNFQYYVFALIFVVFDILSVFLFLWAYVYTGAPGDRALLLPVAALVGIMLLALGYSLKKESRIVI
ncbi:MAG: NADH-quinone oxidoreductase subunit A [Euryarchaeota archaeon]|nr:NADH-quinone oxidoreductase subunit A [Euryarchaeota archaeon]